MRLAVSRRLRAIVLAIAAVSAGTGCTGEDPSPRLEPARQLTRAAQVREPGDSADALTWAARRDAVAARLGSGGVGQAADLVAAARASRNVALALAEPEERAAELARAERWARDGLRAAPGDPDARLVVARIELDRFREGHAGGEALVDAGRLLASVVAEDRAFGQGAALGSLAESYALAGARRPEAPELERAAALFEAALDVSRDYLPAHLDYAERVLLPWNDRVSAARHLRLCAEHPLTSAVEGDRFADDDRAQRRCAELILGDLGRSGGSPLR